MAGQTAATGRQTLTLGDNALDGTAGEYFGKGLLRRQPCLIGGELIDNDLTAHIVMANTTVLGTGDIKGAKHRRSKPKIRHLSWNQVHLGAKIGHIKIV